MAEMYYLLQSKDNGQYLSARQPGSKAVSGEQQRYLLIFQHDFEALSYLNAHAPDLQERFAVGSHSLKQLKVSLERWGFVGIAFVTDPLEPQVDFMARTFL